jgi:hypothetical protein
MHAASRGIRWRLRRFEVLPTLRSRNRPLRLTLRFMHVLPPRRSNALHDESIAIWTLAPDERIPLLPTRTDHPPSRPGQRRTTGLR